MSTTQARVTFTIMHMKVTPVVPSIGVPDFLAEPTTNAQIPGESRIKAPKVFSGYHLDALADDCCIHHFRPFCATT
jgi:hypothetical protein